MSNDTNQNLQNVVLDNPFVDAPEEDIVNPFVGDTEQMEKEMPFLEHLKSSTSLVDTKNENSDKRTQKKKKPKKKRVEINLVDKFMPYYELLANNPQFRWIILRFFIY